jgi:PEP-CTERM motif
VNWPFTATFNNIPPDAAFGSFEVVAWDNSSGLYPTWAQASMGWQGGLIYAGRSQEFTLAMTPPQVTPTLSFRIGLIPEPSAAVLMGLGAAAFLYVGRRK